MFDTDYRLVTGTFFYHQYFSFLTLLMFDSIDFPLPPQALGFAPTQKILPPPMWSLGFRSRRPMTCNLLYPVVIWTITKNCFPFGVLTYSGHRSLATDNALNPRLLDYITQTSNCLNLRLCTSAYFMHDAQGIKLIIFINPSYYFYLFLK